MNQAYVRGFTVVELVVTIAILSILTAVVYANVGQFREKARDGEREAELGTIAIAIRNYADFYRQYPACPAGMYLEPSRAYPGDSCGDESALWDYLGNAAFSGGIPTDPRGPGNSELFYYYSSSHNCGGEPSVLVATQLENRSGNVATVCGTTGSFTVPAGFTDVDKVYVVKLN